MVVAQFTLNTSRQPPARSAAAATHGTARGTASANRNTEKAGTPRLAATSMRRGRKRSKTTPPGTAPKAEAAKRAPQPPAPARWGLAPSGPKNPVGAGGAAP